MSYVKNGILYNVLNGEIENGTFLIPDGVTKIGNHAFWGCGSLKKITIPESVTEIENYAFWGCESLKIITIPESITKIGRGAFDCCNSLQSVEIMNPDAVIMDLHPFFCCENLKIVKIGNTVHQVECVDYNCMEILSRKQAGSMEIIHAKYFNNDEESYIAKEDGLSTHGDSIREAVSDLTFKKMQQLDVSEHVARIKAQGYVTPEDYRLVTGACRQGTEQFLKEKGFTWEGRLSIPETLEAVKGYWGAERFTELMTS